MRGEAAVGRLPAGMGVEMKIYRCKKGFALGVKAGTKFVRAGQIVREDHPLFAGRGDLLANTNLFEPLDDYVQRSAGVEQATAAPGEKRTVTPPAEPKKPARSRGAEPKEGQK